MIPMWRRGYIGHGNVSLVSRGRRSTPTIIFCPWETLVIALTLGTAQRLRQLTGSKKSSVGSALPQTESPTLLWELAISFPSDHITMVAVSLRSKNLLINYINYIIIILLYQNSITMVALSLRCKGGSP